MKIEYRIGDLLRSPETMIVHGCNAKGAMGKGIARSIREQMPWAYEAYRREHLKEIIERENLITNPKLLRSTIYSPDPTGFVGALKLGTIVWAIESKAKLPDEETTRLRIVGNAITQERYRKQVDPDGIQYVSYDAVRSAIKEVNALVLNTQPILGAKENEKPAWEIGPITRVGFPLIGAFLGGGDWAVISEIIESESLNFRPVVYALNGKDLETVGVDLPN